MKLRTSKNDGQSPDFGRSMRAAVACLFVIALLSLAGCGEGGPGMINDAVAAPGAPADAPATYFPTQFPTPEGAPAPHIEAF
jgi:predicted small lipoprotein YifL